MELAGDARLGSDMSLANQFQEVTERDEVLRGFAASWSRSVEMRIALVDGDTLGFAKFKINQGRKSREGRKGRK